MKITLSHAKLFDCRTKSLVIFAQVWSEDEIGDPQSLDLLLLA